MPGHPTEFLFFFQAEDGIRDPLVTGVQTCALPIFGPLESTFHTWAGTAWADWLFMLALAGIGIALTLGVALRIAAISGTVLMLGMWAAEWPLAKVTSAGQPSLSTNPMVDYHLVYALVLIVVALLAAGNTWGFGKLWARLPLVGRNHWLL